jgi:uncharacterized membrane protein YhaH (DUF805 family)
MDWYIAAVKRYAEFSGRSRRREYWMFSLINFGIALAIGVVARFAPIVVVLSVIYSLGVLIPGIAVGIRRLHDTGRSGWWTFIVLIPLVGVIMLLVFLCQDSAPGDNEYGPNPKLTSVQATYA